jgi:hypothetical protein
MNKAIGSPFGTDFTEAFFTEWCGKAAVETFAGLTPFSPGDRRLRKKNRSPQCRETAEILAVSLLGQMDIQMSTGTW